MRPIFENPAAGLPSQMFRATPLLGDDGREEREDSVQVKEGVTEVRSRPCARRATQSSLLLPSS